MSVGVMKDYKLKLRNLRASHTLGCCDNQGNVTAASIVDRDDKFSGHHSSLLYK